MFTYTLNRERNACYFLQNLSCILIKLMQLLILKNLLLMNIDGSSLQIVLSKSYNSLSNGSNWESGENNLELDYDLYAPGSSRA